MIGVFQPTTSVEVSHAHDDRGAGVDPFLVDFDTPRLPRLYRSYSINGSPNLAGEPNTAVGLAAVLDRPLG